ATRMSSELGMNNKRNYFFSAAGEASVQQINAPPCTPLMCRLTVTLPRLLSPNAAYFVPQNSSINAVLFSRLNYSNRLPLTRHNPLRLCTTELCHGQPDCFRRTGIRRCCLCA